MSMPKPLTAWGGIDALTHALESYVSVFASEYTKGLSREAVLLLFKYLPRAYADGQNDAIAREKVRDVGSGRGSSGNTGSCKCILIGSEICSDG